MTVFAVTAQSAFPGMLSQLTQLTSIGCSNITCPSTATLAEVLAALSSLPHLSTMHWEGNPVTRDASVLDAMLTFITEAPALKVRFLSYSNRCLELLLHVPLSCDPFLPLSNCWARVRQSACGQLALSLTRQAGAPGPELQHDRPRSIASLTAVEPVQSLDLGDIDVCRSAVLDTSPFWRILAALTTARSLCEALLTGFFVPANCLERVAQAAAKSPHLKRLALRHTTAAGTAERTDAEAEISVVKLIFDGLSVQDPPCPAPRA
jgi:hypothetical protein